MKRGTLRGPFPPRNDGEKKLAVMEYLSSDDGPRATPADAGEAKASLFFVETPSSSSSPGRQNG